MKEKDSIKYPYSIKGCPFCGAKPKIEQKMLTHAFVVRCVNPECHIQPSTRMFGDLESSVTAWRHRH